MEKHEDINIEEVENNSHSKRDIKRVFVTHSKEIISAVIVGVVVTVLSSYMNGYIFQEVESYGYPTDNYQIAQPQIDANTMRQYYIRANLAKVRASITPIRLMLTEYYMIHGQFPKNSEELDISRFDLEELEVIDRAYLTENGGVGVDLSQEFGNGKILSIEPKLSKHGARISWKCSTNVDEIYLGLSSNRICEPKF